jgi:hypothetical protein
MRNWVILISGVAIVLFIDFAFYEGRLRKEAWAEIQIQQTNVQQWKVNLVSGN